MVIVICTLLFSLVVQGQEIVLEEEMTVSEPDWFLKFNNAISIASQDSLSQYNLPVYGTYTLEVGYHHLLMEGMYVAANLRSMAGEDYMDLGISGLFSYDVIPSKFDFHMVFDIEFLTHFSRIFADYKYWVIPKTGLTLSYHLVDGYIIPSYAIKSYFEVLPEKIVYLYGVYGLSSRITKWFELSFNFHHLYLRKEMVSNGKSEDHSSFVNGFFSLSIVFYYQ